MAPPEERCGRARCARCAQGHTEAGGRRSEANPPSRPHPRRCQGPAVPSEVEQSHRRARPSGYAVERGGFCCPPRTHLEFGSPSRLWEQAGVPRRPAGGARVCHQHVVPQLPLGDTRPRAGHRSPRRAVPDARQLPTAGPRPRRGRKQPVSTGNKEAFCPKPHIHSPRPRSVRRCSR